MEYEWRNYCINYIKLKFFNKKYKKLDFFKTTVIRLTNICLLDKMLSRSILKKVRSFEMKRTLQISLVVVIVDQMIKFFMTTFLANQEITIIPHFFSLIYALNTGAAWSLFSGDRFFLIMVTFLFLGFLYYFFLKDQNLKWSEKIGMGFLIGGIIGNLIDRILFGYVIDYLSFTFFSYQFPIFNFADTCIVVSILLLILLSVSEVVPWKSK